MSIIRCTEPMVGTDLISLLLNCLTDPDWILLDKISIIFMGLFRALRPKIDPILALNALTSIAVNDVFPLSSLSLCFASVLARLKPNEDAF